MALIERIQDTRDAGYWTGRIPLNYVYTAGRAGEMFFRKLKDQGKFTGASCPKCSRVYLPARIFCERCFERLEGNVVDVPNSGVVETFTVCHETYDEKHKQPTIVAFIRLDGTDGGLMHWLAKIDPEEVFIGLPVKAVFKPKAQRVGSILDIEHFVPAV
jgi:uncharacterized OB-fold protein